MRRLALQDFIVSSGIKTMMLHPFAFKAPKINEQVEITDEEMKYELQQYYIITIHDIQIIDL